MLSRYPCKANKSFPDPVFLGITRTLPNPGNRKLNAACGKVRISMRISRLKANLFLHDWEIQAGESWCVIGGNASGKGLLASVLTGELKPSPGKSTTCLALLAASLSNSNVFYEEQLRNDDTDYIDRLDTGSTGLEVLQQSGCSRSTAIELADRLGVGYILKEAIGSL